MTSVQDGWLILLSNLLTRGVTSQLGDWKVIFTVMTTQHDSDASPEGISSSASSNDVIHRVGLDPGMDSSRSAVGAQLKLIRKRRNMTQDDVGKKLATYLGSPWHRQQVSAAENGQRAFQIIDLIALAAVFDVPLTDILLPVMRDTVVFPTGATWIPRKPEHMELSWESLSVIENMISDSRMSLTAAMSWLRRRANEQRDAQLPDDPGLAD